MDSETAGLADGLIKPRNGNFYAVGADLFLCVQGRINNITEELVEPGFISEYVCLGILCFTNKVFSIVTFSIVFKGNQVAFGYFILTASKSRTLMPCYKKLQMAEAGYNIGST
ncbi:MAG TPA: hypothetical protein DDY81_08350 [Clostridiales bacterium]|nr:hypothetical protein [Clostridiales bacterium]